MIDSDLIQKAQDFAERYHKNQTRKFDGTAYIEHPLSVSKRVEELTHDQDMIIAALLHDTLEDTNAQPDQIRQLFGEKILKLVLELTSDQESAQHEGKANYLTEKINHMSPNARLIKLADREHNVSDLDRVPEKFAKRYATETDFILKHLEFSPNESEQLLIDSIKNKIEKFR